MNERRGCMCALFHQGYIYAIGGLNYTDKIMKKCERLLLIDKDSSPQNGKIKL